jgi:CheY-like chemotaxis protein
VTFALLSNDVNVIGFVKHALPEHEIRTHGSGFDVIPSLLLEENDTCQLLIVDLTLAQEAERLVMFVKSSPKTQGRPVITLGTERDYNALTPGVIDTINGVVTLPCPASTFADVVASIAVDVPLEVAHESSQPATERRGPCMENILIADDDPGYSFLIKRVLDELGRDARIQTVEDGAKAIAYLEGAGEYSDRASYPLPKLFFLDLKMPRTNGFDVLRWMQDNPRYRAIPTVVLSGSVLDSDTNLAYRLGAQAYVPKPGDLAALREMLQAACIFWTFAARPPAAASSST